MCTPCSQKKMYRKGFGPVGKKTQEKEGDVLTYALGYILGRNFTFLLPSLPFSLLVFAPRKKERRAGSRKDSYLVDPASSHMLVSKIKPCMSKYKQPYTVKLRMAH